MTHFELLKYAATGIASPGMTAYDKMRAVAMAGGGAIKTLTGVPPLSFRANGKPLISWSMLGNGQQTGTPTSDNPIMPTFCGKLVESDWTIPITNAGQTQNVYLGDVQTVRRVRKLVLDGTETWYKSNTEIADRAYFATQITSDSVVEGKGLCTHFVNTTVYTVTTDSGFRFVSNGGLRIRTPDVATLSLDAFKQWLAAQYAAGTPVTVWYVLAEPETAIVNEPLCKIGDYADELHSEDAGVSIPTARGQNTLTVDTDLQPSSMTITYR